MSAKILDGKVVRDEIAKTLKNEIENLGAKPKLVIIQIGDNPESNTYISQKKKFGEKIGAVVEHKKLEADIDQESLKSLISTLNSNKSIHGIIVQMPIPTHLDKDEIIDLIDPKKDVDGLTDTNQKLLEANNPGAIIPATPKGVLSLLNFYDIEVKNKKVTVVGRSRLVGAPLATLLQNLGADVTIGHSQTEDLMAITKSSDILVVAVGKQNLITKDHVSPGQVVIDVGINLVEKDQTLSSDQIKEKGLALTQAKPEAEPASHKLVGDVDFQEVSQIVAAISPVPGGIGPMTVASLFENLVEAYKKQYS